MQHSEGTFTATDGLALYYQAWHPDPKEHSASDIVLAVVHGGGEHSGRYLNPVEYFVPRGHPFYVYDLRGHGKSAGKRGHILSFDQYLSDTEVFLNLIRLREPNKTVFLMGHSLGGLIASAYALDHPRLAGLILSSPFLQIKIPVPRWKTGLGRIFSSLFPGMAFKNGINVDDLSHNISVAANYRKDPYVHSQTTARTYTEIVKMQAAVLHRADELKIPFLLCYAGSDLIADPSGSRLFFNRVTSGNKTSFCYEGSYHEIFNELNNQQVFSDIKTWLVKQTKK